MLSHKSVPGIPLRLSKWRLSTPPVDHSSEKEQPLFQNLLESIDHCKRLVQVRLEHQTFENKQELLGAFEEALEKVAYPLLGFTEPHNGSEKDLSRSNRVRPRARAKLMRSYHLAQLIRCVKHSIWLELVEDFFPSEPELTNSGLPMDETSPNDVAALAKSGSGNKRLILKLRMPEMRSGPGSLFETVCLDKGIWCWSSRRTWSKVEGSFPDIKLLSPPMTWRKNGQEIHVYHIAVPRLRHRAFFLAMRRISTDFGTDFVEGKMHHSRGKGYSVFHVSIPCSEFDCTEKWMPKHEAVSQT